MWTTISNFFAGGGWLILVGIVVVPCVQWGVKWLDGKGAEFVKTELEALRKKMNENSVLSQISADDAIIDILESTIPDVLAEVNTEVHDHILNGRITSIDWAQFGRNLWTKAKEHIVGGANDYLKNSSFQDGEKLAAMIAQRFFNTQKMAAKGLIVDMPRADTPVQETLKVVTAVGTESKDK